MIGPSPIGKMWASLIAGVLVRLFMRWTGLDFVALGIDQEVLRLSVEGLLMAIAVGIPTFFVWAVRNVDKALHIEVPADTPVVVMPSPDGKDIETQITDRGAEVKVTPTKDAG